MEEGSIFGFEKKESGVTELGEVFTYKGYEVTVVEREAEDVTPAESTIDMRTGRRIILLYEGIPRNLVVPLLEHEVYEIEHNFNHQAAEDFGRVKAKELGVLEELLDFERNWSKPEKNLKNQK